jgi:polyisoprenoid-binding protein YceI
MSESWSLDATSGQLLIHTGVAGPAAKTGHRLTIGMQTWQAMVNWRGKEPVGVDLTVSVDSLEVLKGEGGVTPLGGPEKGIARSNALKSLDVKKFPHIRFTAADIAKSPEGFRLSGTVEIHGTSRPQMIDLKVEDRGDLWAMTAQVPITQSDFVVKPYSLLMGAIKVADQVTIDFSATHAK